MKLLFSQLFHLKLVDFSFDGEEIKAIAKQDPEQAVINGINALLGFDVLEQLVVDLETLKRNLRKELLVQLILAY